MFSPAGSLVLRRIEQERDAERWEEPHQRDSVIGGKARNNNRGETKGN